MRKAGKYICLFLFIPSLLYASDTIKSRKIKVMPVPAFGYSPETRTYVGAVTLFTLDFYGDSDTRRSNAKLEFNYSWNKQVIFDSEWNYFFKEENWFTKGRFHYSKYPDFYYGIGENTPDSNKLVFNSNRFIFEVHALKGLGENFFMGPNIKYTRYYHVKYNISNTSFPELTDGETFGIGYSLLKDTRNNLLTPTHGLLIYLNAGYNFSKKNYLEFTLDMRYYKTWKERYTFATRFLNDLNMGSTPFYNMSFLGGDENVRGYYYGRYRDNNLTTIQSEFRFPVYWRIGLAAFGGLSNIYSRQHTFSFNKFKVNGGLGIRFLVDKNEKTNLRFDYAMGSHGSSGFYISFGESF
jgi:hypothetical protein